MQVEDLILVSVDDHVVEPTTLFRRPICRDVGRSGPELCERTTVSTCGSYRGRGAPEHRAQRGRGTTPRGVHDGADATTNPHRLLRHPRARPRHERQRCARLDVLPELPAVLRPAVQRTARRTPMSRRIASGLQRLAHRRSCGTIRVVSSRCHSPPIWDPEPMADEMRRVAKKGCHAVTFSENPVNLGYPSIHSALSAAAR